MRRTAVVFAINRARGVVAAIAPDGYCTIFQLLGESNVDVGDIVEGDLRTPDALQSFFNLTKAMLIEVHVRGVDVGRDALRAWLT